MSTRRGRLHALRLRVHGLPGGRVLWRVLVTLLGVLVMVIGVVLLPLPGPGWLIIFAGLGVLATEYAWAHRLLHRTRRAVGDWTRWSMRQHILVRLAIGLGGLTLILGVGVGSWYVYRGA